MRSILSLALTSCLLLPAACGSKDDDKFTAYEVTPTAALTAEESATLTEGCTKIVTGHGTFSTEDDCKTYLTNTVQTEGHEYRCVKEKTAVSCK